MGVVTPFLFLFVVDVVVVVVISVAKETGASAADLVRVKPADVKMARTDRATLSCWVRSVETPLVRWLRPADADDRRRGHRDAAAFHIGAARFRSASIPSRTFMVKLGYVRLG